MTGRLVRRFEGPLAIGKPFVDQSGQRLISIGHDRSQQAVIRVWDIKTGRLRTEEETILGPIFDIGAVRQTLGGFWNMAIALHGNTVAISGGLGQTRLWDTRTQKELTIIYSRQIRLYFGVCPQIINLAHFPCYASVR
jgi:WD40 repeat protein